MLTILIKAKLTCPKHSSFDPVKTGESGIKANCTFCWAIHDAHMKATALRLCLSEVKQIIGK